MKGSNDTYIKELLKKTNTILSKYGADEVSLPNKEGGNRYLKIHALNKYGEEWISLISTNKSYEFSAIGKNEEEFLIDLEKELESITEFALDDIEHEFEKIENKFKVAEGSYHTIQSDIIIKSISTSEEWNNKVITKDNVLDFIKEVSDNISNNIYLQTINRSSNSIENIELSTSEQVYEYFEKLVDSIKQEEDNTFVSRKTMIDKIDEYNELNTGSEKINIKDFEEKYASVSKDLIKFNSYIELNNQIKEFKQSQGSSHSKVHELENE